MSYYKSPKRKKLYHVFQWFFNGEDVGVSGEGEMNTGTITRVLSCDENGFFTVTQDGGQQEVTTVQCVSTP